MKTRIFLVLMSFFVGTSYIGAQNGSVDLFQGAVLVLPEKAGISCRWVLPPQTKAVVDSIIGEYPSLSFGMDETGNPVIGHSDRYVLNPEKRYQMRLSQPFKSMVYMDNGAAFFSTEAEFGLAIPSEPVVSDEKGFPIVPFQPIATLPFPECSMFQGAGECLYFSGYNNASGLNEVYLLKPRTASLGGVNSQVLSGYQKVFSTAEDVTAVTGDVSNCFVALGRLVVRISVADGKVSRYFLHPDKEIFDLVYSPQAGLIYTTSDGVGYAGTNGSLDFFNGPYASLCLRGDTLYLLFNSSLGVLALEHLSGLRTLDLNPVAISSPLPKNLSKPSLKFFSYSPPDYKGSEYAERFDRSATYFVACQVHFDSLSFKGTEKHVLSTRWFLGNDLVHSGSEVAVFSPGEKSRSFLFPMGGIWSGNMYPGKYRVQLLWDGVPLSEGVFYVYGEVTGFEAIAHQDTALLRELLENGLDPNIPSESSFFPYLLHLAAAQGTVEDMRLILEHGAKVNQIDALGETALFLCNYGDISQTLEKIRLLIQYKINVNVRDNIGLTAFTANMPSEGSLIEVLKVLLEAGAQINVPLVEEDESALHSALIKGAMDNQMLAFLLSKGAMFTKGQEEREFRSVLIQNPNPDFVRLLLGKGKELGILTSLGTLSPNATPSLLQTVLTGVLEASAKDDRPRVQQGMEVVRLLMTAGAKLRPEEERIILNKSLFRELDVDFITPILSRNESFLLPAAALNDTRLYGWIMDRLLAAVRSKVDRAISNNDLEDALKMSDGMRVIMEASGTIQWPSVYLYCGVLQQQLTRNALALSNYKKYIELAPPGTDVSKVRSEMRKLE